MTTKELFGVGVRLMGLAAVMVALPDLFQLNYLAAAPAVAGLILITRADLIVQLCYPADARKEEWRERIPPKDFRDS